MRPPRCSSSIDEGAARSETGVKAEGATFHGRDIFAPVAAAIARGADPMSLARPVEGIRMLAGVPQCLHRRRNACVAPAATSIISATC